MNILTRDEGTGSEYARIFRLLSAAKDEAQKLKLHNLMHLTNMALLQVVIDWDGIDPERELDVNLEKLIGKKTQVAMKDASENLVLLDCH
ncbi:MULTISPECIES: hypothetical protein [unclassified Rhizobium]|uniref:hypothetical protein n=1 Tax=unclassified Rhizobium TaxID=2613769 RepID=UPI00027197E9|nr:MULTISPECIES: hypothetical protein [unclassified Rhizobium]EJL53360.1 hypothetical protein PMI09_03156 [Rhizobium sp. CF122]MBB3393691.1 hypothetical protein [Rhizobium sp. BK060]MBB4166408.1 hypothetical protein [Rhizobium sp. BK538]MBZ9793794.1 hypothetical protein [Rhizobium sp. 3T7]TCM81707.1 hypothetical protein EV291_101183 [Rhizobium sp. BK068]